VAFACGEEAATFDLLTLALLAFGLLAFALLAFALFALAKRQSSKITERHSAFACGKLGNWQKWQNSFYNTGLFVNTLKFLKFGQ